MSNTENSAGAIPSIVSIDKLDKPSLEVIRKFQQKSGETKLNQVEDLLIQVFRTDFLKVAQQDFPEAKDLGIGLLQLLGIFEEVVEQRRTQVAAYDALQKALQKQVDERGNECRARYFGLSAVVKLVKSLEEEIDKSVESNDWSKLNSPINPNVYKD